MKNLKSKFIEPNGSLNGNGKIIISVASLLIVLIQQLLAAFQIKFSGNWIAIVAVVNTERQ
ncbi:hypothetical protein KBX49_11920 [Liquorilactobacillus satsumensis]|uniref:hypothetical protein n=1 Tax=Liquorilactobacillus satsumensis TaxID=259059 RepID=UPI0021C28248|nr:hypothetical protein [Liquorilactobacillus satsumensis]MCP9358630.1 hypothetical protein [Liquorilactobacillus satsumensis]MCP9372597.1 hypothetical protein [Liquorilactobacillus satsumensis]